MRPVPSIRVLALTAGVAACLILPARSQGQSRDVIAARLEALLTDLHDRALFSGAVVVGSRSGVRWQKGFGFADKVRRVAFAPDTPSDSGSLAKTFTAALVLALQAEGRLRLDDPVQRYLPELPERAITIRHLLSHSTGLPSDYAYFDRFIPADAERTTEALLKVLAEQKPRLAFRPGTAFEYNSIGYDLASLVAARAAGTSYARLIEQRVFRPLGLGSAFLRPARLHAFPGVRTLAYRRAGAADLDLHEVFDFEHFHGGSNIYISARDLHAWNVALWGGTVARGAKPEIARLARINGAASGLTLGSWYRSGAGDAFWYAGHLQGFHNEAFIDTRLDQSIVYVSNNTLEPWLQHGLVRAIRGVLNGAAVQPLSRPEVAAIAKDAWPSLAGTWRLARGAPLVVRVAAGRATVTYNGVEYQMFPVDGSFFYVPGLHFMIGFAQDGNTWSRIYVSTNLSEAWGNRVF
jgi:CubicO group peptidase (beta-lactamase class C family)